ncbi:hypothetical protein A2U01_0056244 [Trifolium medium]|uniref:Uncharacterized protein n=1 Tax=Trifolium medium TaxID=97028 RepID=A0A392REG5_9FABA|nr:hypothetical protein [Trifolium medium]
MARCAVQAEIKGILSGMCASRSTVWRGAQLNQTVKRNLLEVARRARWAYATRQYKIQAANV